MTVEENRKMITKSELKAKYKEFIRNGRKKEAQKILKQIWNMEPVTKRVSPKAKSKKIFSKKNESLDSLSNIKGIGKETVEDIKKVYDSISSLESALKKNKVPLRNDIVLKLKKHFL